MNNSNLSSFTEASVAQPFFTTASTQFPPLSTYRTWLESQGGAIGVMRTSAVIEADLNRDGVNELVVQFSSYPSGALGATTNLATPNRLVIFASDSNGVLSDVTTKYLAANATSPVTLGGQVIGFAVGDLNADGRNDLALALNRDDGRSQLSNLAARNVVLLSQSDGTYSTLSLDPGSAQTNAVSQSVMILNRGTGELPQLVFSAKGADQSTGAALLRFGLQTNSQVDSFKLLGVDAVDQPQDLVPLPTQQLMVSSATTRFLALDDTRGVVQYRVNADTSLTETGASFLLDINEKVIRTAAGTIGEFGTEPTVARVYASGEALYVVRGIDAAAYVKPAAGADDMLVVAIRLQRVTATEDESGDLIVSGLGAERSLLNLVGAGVYEPGIPEVGSFKSDTESSLRVAAIKAIDLNGDGHQDLVVSYLGGTPSTALFVNSGSGNFYAVSASSLPDVSDLVRGNRGDVVPSFINLGSDQITDLLFVNASQNYNAGNFYLFQGTGSLSTGPYFNQTAVIGFNEKYYLENNSEALVAVDTGLFQTGLDYYLSQGSPPDALIFAPGTRLTGTSLADLIRAREGSELIDAGVGNDRIYPGQGNDTVLGGGGLDTVFYEGQRSQYKVSKTTYQGQNAWQVSDPIEGEVDLLVGIEKLEFAQALPDNPASEVTLDIDGNPAIAFRLYRAAFAREPDLAGLGYWVDVLIQNQNNPSIAPDQNLLLLDIASAFVGSPEFKSLYGDDVSSGDYVLNLYKNTLGRDPLEVNPLTGQSYDQAGYEYWKSVLEAGATTRQHMFVFFSESQENRNAVAELIGQGIEYIPWSG